MLSDDSARVELMKEETKHHSVLNFVMKMIIDDMHTLPLSVTRSSGTKAKVG